MPKNLNRLLLILFISGLTWAVGSDWLITRFCSGLSTRKLELVRISNNISWFGPTLLILYWQIRKQQRSLETSENQYRALFAANPNPMWIYDIETLHFITVNEACKVTYGYTLSQFQGMSIYDIRPAEERGRLHDFVRAPYQTIRQAGIWQHRKASGEMFMVSVISHPVNFDGRSCKLVMATDVTELIEKKARLKQSNETLLQIAWSHSHQLRKPLCSIIGIIPLLREAVNKREREHLLHMLEHSATELDDAIRHNSAAVSELSAEDLEIH